MANGERWFATAMIDGEVRVCADDEYARDALKTAREMLSGAYDTHPDLEAMIDSLSAWSQSAVRHYFPRAYREWQWSAKEAQDAVFTDGGAN